MIELDEILRLAARMNSDDPGADFDAAVDRLTTAELRDVMLAGKMLAGRALRIDTDNPKTVARARALAAVSARSRLGTACFRTCDKLRQAARILNRINGNDKMPCPTCG